MQLDVDDNERTGQGKKVDGRIVEAIRSTLVYRWIDGARRQQLSAESVLNHISNERPDLVQSLPSPQTVRRIIKPIRERLEKVEGVGYLDEPWSLGTVNVGIDEDAHPLLLRINKALALDVGEERQRTRFSPNRLTVREARWVSKLRNSVQAANESHEPRSPDLEMIRLTDLAKRYARRELAVQVLGEDLDTYDLDMKLAFNAAFPVLPGQLQDHQLWMLALELRLIPPSTLSEPAESLERELNFPGNDLSDLEHVDLRTQLAAAQVSMSLVKIVRRLEDEGIKLRVRFGTEDWDRDSIAHHIRLFTTQADYDVDQRVLGMCLEITRSSAGGAGGDSDQVKIARAFLKKVTSALNEKLKDPNVRQIFDLPELAAEPEQPGEGDLGS